MVYPNYCIWIINRILKRSLRQPNGCIEYQGNDKHKYGLISITVDSKRIVVPASRAMYIATNQAWDLPGSTQVRHKCDNPRCVNIEHLEPGTAKDNAQDMLGRGRNAKKYKLHTRHRIHDDAIIKAIKSETGRNHDIALKYDVSDSYVSKIRSGKAKTLI